MVGRPRIALGSVLASLAGDEGAAARPAGREKVRTPVTYLSLGQTARLEHDREWVAIVILADGDIRMEYGIETVEGVARRLVASDGRLD